MDGLGARRTTAPEVFLSADKDVGATEGVEGLERDVGHGNNEDEVVVHHQRRPCRSKSENEWKGEQPRQKGVMEQTPKTEWEQMSARHDDKPPQPS